MKYYILRHETNNKIVGVGNQIQSSDKWGPTPYVPIPVDGPINFDFELPIFFMERRAKPTDYLTCVPLSGSFQVFSPKALEVFEKLSLDSYQAYPIQVKHKEEMYNFVALRFSYGRHREFINWAKSEFGLVNRKNGYLPNGEWSYIEDIKFNSWDEFNNRLQPLLNTDFHIRSKKLVYIENMDLDIFRMGNPVVKHFCSEKFKQAVESAGLTGFAFEKI